MQILTFDDWPPVNAAKKLIENCNTLQFEIGFVAVLADLLGVWWNYATLEIKAARDCIGPLVNILCMLKPIIALRSTGLNVGPNYDAVMYFNALTLLRVLQDRDDSKYATLDQATESHDGDTFAKQAFLWAKCIQMLACLNMVATNASSAPQRKKTSS